MDQPKWREFEKRIAELERAMDKYGISVVSPGWLQDKDTDSQREIDVLVTVPYAPNPLYVMIECRRRSEVQDVTWIEQLATKRNSVNANHVIAVSLNGFGKPAREKARILGIETRTLKELSPDSLLETVYISSFTFERLHRNNFSISIDCGPLLAHPGVPCPDIPASLKQALELRDNEAKIFLDIRNQKSMSISDVLRNTVWDTVSRELSPGMPPTRCSLRVDISGSPPPIQIPGSEPVYLWGYTATADFWVERFVLTPTCFYEYTGENGLLMRRVEYDLSPGGTNCTLLLDLHPPNSEGAIAAIPTLRYEGAEPPPILRLRNYWTPPSKAQREGANSDKPVEG